MCRPLRHGTRHKVFNIKYSKLTSIDIALKCYRSCVGSLLKYLQNFSVLSKKHIRWLNRNKWAALLYSDGQPVAQWSTLVQCRGPRVLFYQDVISMVSSCSPIFAWNSYGYSAQKHTQVNYIFPKWLSSVCCMTLDCNLHWCVHWCKRFSVLHKELWNLLALYNLLTICSFPAAFIWCVRFVSCTDT